MVLLYLESGSDDSGDAQHVTGVVIGATIGGAAAILIIAVVSIGLWRTGRCSCSSKGNVDLGI